MERCVSLVLLKLQLINILITSLHQFYILENGLGKLLIMVNGGAQFVLAVIWSFIKIYFSFESILANHAKKGFLLLCSCLITTMDSACFTSNFSE